MEGKRGGGVRGGGGGDLNSASWAFFTADFFHTLIQLYSTYYLYSIVRVSYGYCILGDTVRILGIPYLR